MQPESAAPAAMLPAAPAPVFRAQWLRRALPLLQLAFSRGGAVLAQFAAQLVVAAMAGASGLGVLQMFTSWTCIGGEVLALGLPTRVLRQASVDYAEQRREAIVRVVAEARRSILGIWLKFALGGLTLGLGLLYTGVLAVDGEYGWLLAGALLAAPLFSLARLYAESLKATDATLSAVTLESLTSPVALLVLCGCYWMAGWELAAKSLVVTFALSIAVTQLAMRSLLRRRLCRMPGSSGPAPDAVAPAFSGDLLYLWAIGILSIVFVQLPFLVMPLFVDTAEIGVFAIAHKLINVITTLLILLAAIFGPRFARSAAQRDQLALRALLWRTQLASSAIFIPAAAAMILLAGPLTSWFGEEFSGMRHYLLILAAGQLFNALTGLSGVLLNMAGAARGELATLVVTLAAALAASVLVGPAYGATGLAWLFSATIAVKNLASYTLALRLLHTKGGVA